MSDDAKPYAVAEVETLPRDKRSGILRQAVRVDHSRLLATVRALEAATERAEAAEAACAELHVLARRLADLMPTNGPEEHWAIQESQRRMATVEKRIAALDVGKGWASPAEVRELANLAWRHGFAYALGREVGGVEARGDMPAIIARVLGGGR